MLNDNKLLDKASIYFSGNEIEKRKKINALMGDWKKEISNKAPIVFHDDGIEYDTSDYFGSDGFFPNYYNQETKVLFIGREARDNSGNDFVEKLINEFKRTTYIYKSIFWRRVLYILYGIRKNGKVKYENIPNVTEIIAEMTESNNYGFAFMNISKYSNDREDGGSADLWLINRFLVDTCIEKRNFIKEEIELIDPDIIITANLWDGKISNKYLDLCFPNKELVSYIENKANYYRLRINDKDIKLIDLWHFSKPGSDKENYFDPVVELLYKRN